MENYLFWLMTAAYAAHIMEEYVLDWKQWVYGISRIEVSWSDFFVTNFAVIILGICFSMIGWGYPEISLSFAALLLINGLLFHILPTIIKRNLSPGVITSILLFLPLSIFTYYVAYEIHKITINIMLMSLLYGGILMSYPIFLQKVKTFR